MGSVVSSAIEKVRSFAIQKRIGVNLPYTSANYGKRPATRNAWRMLDEGQPLSKGRTLNELARGITQKQHDRCVGGEHVRSVHHSGECRAMSTVPLVDVGDGAASLRVQEHGVHQLVRAGDERLVEVVRDRRRVAVHVRRVRPDVRVTVEVLD
eukprot:5460079-Pleurochrysis_carterae.AAC.1